MTSVRPAESASLTDHLRHWARHRPQQRAFSHVDFPDSAPTGVHRALGWRALDARARAVADRLVAGRLPRRTRRTRACPRGSTTRPASSAACTRASSPYPSSVPNSPATKGDWRPSWPTANRPVCSATPRTARAMGEFIRDRGLAEVPVVPVDQLPVQRGGSIDSGEPSGSSRAGRHRLPPVHLRLHPQPGRRDDQPRQRRRQRPPGHRRVHRRPGRRHHGRLAAALPRHGPRPEHRRARRAAASRPSSWTPSPSSSDPARWLRSSARTRAPSAPPRTSPTTTAWPAPPPRSSTNSAWTAYGCSINGSEPVRAGTVDRFHAAFAPAGLDPAAHCPAYGLAEATVFVTASSRDEPSAAVACDADALTEGRIERDGRTRRPAVLVPVRGARRAAAADRRPGRCRAAGRARSARSRCAAPTSGSATGSAPEHTADDFGLAARPGTGCAPATSAPCTTGELLVTGRLKDLLIVDGRNHYPQDVEETVQAAVGPVAGTGSPRSAWPGGRRRAGRRGRASTGADDRADAEDTHRRRTGRARRGLRPSRTAARRLLLVPPGTVPRTISGKVSRAGHPGALPRGGFGAAMSAVARGRSAELVAERLQALVRRSRSRRESPTTGPWRRPACPPGRAAGADAASSETGRTAARRTAAVGGTRRSTPW